MTKVLRISSCVFVLLAVICSAAWSMDYVNMSNVELFELRGAIQNAPDAERKVYQVEWEKRVAGMTDEEKKQFVDSEQNAENNEDGLDQPRVPGRGYEKQVEQGRVIFGGFPQNGSPGR